MLRRLKNSTRLYPVTGAWLGFLMAFSAIAGEATFLNDFNIRLYGESTHVNPVRELIVHCEKELDKTLPHLSRRNNRWLSIFILNPGEKPPALPPVGKNMIITVTAPADEVVFSCVRGLISQRLDAPDKTLRYFDWIAAAIVFDTLHTRDPSGMEKPDYRVIEAALSKGAPPTPGDLASYSISPDWRHVFLLFATWSHCYYSLLDQTPAEKISGLDRFTHHLNRGSPPKEAWEKTWGKCESNHQTPTQWLDENLRFLVSRYSVDQSDVTRLMDEVNDILGVAVLIPGPDGRMEYQKIAIHQLRIRFPETRLDNETLQIKERKIFTLLKRVPLSLQQPLANYMGALQERKKGLSWKKFLILLEKAESDLETALKNYRGTLAWLNEIEKHYNETHNSLLPALQVSVQHAVRTRSLAPEITRFLDRFSTGKSPPRYP